MADKAARKRANDKLQREIRQLHGEVDAHHTRGFTLGPISCTRGCSACCRTLVLSEVSEAEYILVRRPDAVRRALPLLVQHALRASAIEHELDTEENVAKAASAYWQLNMPCAFLVGAECSIYEDRPLPCRVHFVQSDPALCAAGARTRVQIADFGTRTAAPDRLFALVASVRDGHLRIGTLPQLMVEVMWRRPAWRKYLHALADRGDERADG